MAVLKRYDGSQWVTPVLRRYNGTTWECVTMSRYDGADWEDVETACAPISYVVPTPTVLVSNGSAVDTTSYATASFALVAGSQYFFCFGASDMSAGRYPTSITQTGITWSMVVGEIYEWMSMSIWSGVASSSTTSAATITLDATQQGVIWDVIRMDNVGTPVQSDGNGANLADTVTLPLTLATFQAGSSLLVSGIRNSTAGGIGNTAGLTSLTHHSVNDAGQLKTMWSNGQPTFPVGYVGSGASRRNVIVGVELAGIAV